MWLPLALSFIAACSSSADYGSTTTGPNANLVAAKASASGDAQTGRAGAALATPFSVIVKNGSSPIDNVEVNWTIVAGGGTLSPNVTETGTNGIASVTWTLGPSVGAQSVQATVASATGSPVTFTATATAASVVRAPSGASR